MIMKVLTNLVCAVGMCVCMGMCVWCMGVCICVPEGTCAHMHAFVNMKVRG